MFFCLFTPVCCRSTSYYYIYFKKLSGNADPVLCFATLFWVKILSLLFVIHGPRTTISHAHIGCSLPWSKSMSIIDVLLSDEVTNYCPRQGIVSSFRHICFHISSIPSLMQRTLITLGRPMLWGSSFLSGTYNLDVACVALYLYISFSQSLNSRHRFHLVMEIDTYVIRVLLWLWWVYWRTWSLIISSLVWHCSCHLK